MKKLFFILCFLNTVLSLKAQDQKPCFCDSSYSRFFEPKLSGETYYPLVNMTGKEYYIENYMTGSIELEDGTVLTGRSLKYNGRIDGVLLNPPKSPKEILLDKFFIKGFCLNMKNQNICFRKITVKKDVGSDSMQIFGQLLYDSKLSLYIYRRFTHQQNVIVNTASGMVSREMYEPAYVNYFKLPDGRTIGFRSFRKRDLYKLFPGNRELMRKLFREKHQRRFRKEEDLIRITQILNEMY